MITLSIVSVFPDLYNSFLQTTLIGRAIKNGLVTVKLYSFSQFCDPKERIDEPTAGPGVGMILKPLVVERAIEHCFAQSGKGRVVFFSPQGELLTQDLLKKLYKKLYDQEDSSRDQDTLLTQDSLAQDFIFKQDHIQNNKPAGVHLVLVCPRYEGVDARIEEHYADWRISVGSFVVMGGDIPAQLFLEAFLRLIPGVVGKEESVSQDSYQGAFVDYPAYGLPVVWKEKSIPAIVQSGNHAVIEEWRKDRAAELTAERSFSWFAGARPSSEEKKRIKKYIPRHYLAIMHTDVLLKNGTVGQTSIPSLDIHDTARACATYGVENFFVVSPLQDQQDIVSTFMDFWRSDVGKKYNQTRFDALKCVQQVYSFEEILTFIRQKEQQEPLIIATSAQAHGYLPMISYDEQSTIWSQKRPVLLLFGTGQGLSQKALERCHYLLEPITGLTSYNHLSVRSAIAIILDRWLGLHPRKK